MHFVMFGKNIKMTLITDVEDNPQHPHRQHGHVRSPPVPVHHASHHAGPHPQLPASGGRSGRFQLQPKHNVSQT